MNNLFCYLFLENFVFFIYKKSIYIAISNETFFDLIHFSDKMMLKKLHTKENQKTYFFGWDKPTQDRNKKHMSTNKYIVYTWICLKTRCLFLVPKRVLWEDKRTPHFETSLHVDFTNFTRNFESMLYHFLFFSFWWSYFEILMSNRRQNIVQFICSWYAVLKTS